MQSSVWRKKHKGAWNKLWSASDNAEDTQVAIDEFMSRGTGKLGMYGVLQAMVVQQDAIMHIEEALGLVPTQLQDTPEMREIRTVRDETTGHPSGTRRNGVMSSYKDGTISYTSVSLAKSSSRVLEYVIWSKDGNEFKKIDLEEAIKKQEEALCRVVDSVIERIQQMEEEHKKKFKDESVQAKLDQTGYFIQKLWPHVEDRQHSEVCLGILRDEYNAFKKAIKARYGHDVFEDSVGRPSLTYTVEKIDKRFPKVEKMILIGQGVDKLDLEVYVESLDNAFEELREIAKEIDGEFGYKVEVEPLGPTPIVSNIKPRKN